MSVTGTVDGGRPPTKIKTDLKKPIVNLACHPRLPVLYVAYAEGLIRAYNIQTYAVHYTLQLAVDSTIKLMGAGAFGFHPTLEWIFVGDRGGTLLAWDVSTERPLLVATLTPVLMKCSLSAKSNTEFLKAPVKLEQLSLGHCSPQSDLVLNLYAALPYVNQKLPLMSQEAMKFPINL
ncbi:uncharacterized protein [Miscanthus floridulus]|uniref:uncharacterized protein n=1 Tax=Miscanthus floridulus TaxID=154761 RepID=UPI0034595FA1